MSLQRHRKLIADGSLLVVAAIWGLTFVTVKNAIVLLPPYSFNFYRFTLATLVMLLFALPRLHDLQKSTVGAGFLLGVLLFSGYSFQTVGLLYTSASNAGFITGLSVVFVPLITFLISRQRPGPGIIAGVLCALTGLIIISAVSPDNFNLGDMLILCCALSFALHIIFVGKFASFHATVWLVSWQIATVALLSGIGALIFEAGIQANLAAVWPALIITALLATCLAFFTQNYMQRFTTASHTAIIFTTEPVFAAFFAILLLQESLSANTYWGGALILAGMLLAEIRNLPCLKINKKALSLPAEQKEKTAGESSSG